MVAAPPLRRLTASDAVEAYMRNVRRAVLGHSLSDKTAAYYERDLAEFVEMVGPETVLDDITAEQVDDVVLAYADRPDGRFRPSPGQQRPKTRSQGTQARFRQSVSRLFSEAELEGWVVQSPMPRTRVRPTARGLATAARKALPQSAATALIVPPPPSEAKPGTRALALRDEFLLRLFTESGPRVSEVSGADQGDLDFRDDGTTWLRVMGKGRKERWIPLSEGTVRAYQAYLKQERPDAKPRTKVLAETGERVVTAPADDAEKALVLTWRGLRMMPRDIQLMVNRACKRLPSQVRRDVTPHGLRHTAATLLLSSGAADVKTVKELLGHASIATTGVYLDTVDGEMANAIRMHPVTGDRPSSDGS